MSRFQNLPSQNRRWLIVLFLALSIWGWVDVRRRGNQYPEQDHKTDLTVYTEAGAAFFDDRAPYEVRNPRGWTYVYPPIFAMLLAPLHALPMQDQATVWFYVCLAMCWGIYCESRRIVALIRDPKGDRTDGRLRWLGVMTLAAVALPAMNCLQRGQVTIAVAYLLVLGLRLVLSGRSYPSAIVGGIVLALSVAIKIVPIIPVGFLLFMLLVAYAWKRWHASCEASQIGRQLFGSTLGVGLGLVLFFLLVPASLVGWSANLHHLQTWSDLVLVSAGDSTATPGFDKDTHSVRNQCLGNALYRLGNFGAYMFAGGPEDPLVDDDNPPPRLMDAPSVNTSLLLVRLTLLLALMLAGIRLGMNGHVPLSLAAGFGLACVALLVVSPVARNHYFVLLTPAVLFVPMWFDRLGGRRAATVLAIVPGVLILLQYALLPYVGRVGLLGLGTTAWLLAAMVLTVRACRAVDDRATLSFVPAKAHPTIPLSDAA
jgi:hypothetical protein